MEKLSDNKLKKHDSILKNIFNKDFIISAIIPIVIFTLFDKMGMTLEGTILSGAWSVGVVCVNFIIVHEINALAAISAIFSGIGIIGTIISRNPSFYLVSPIVKDILFALMLLGSLFFKRTIIQIVVEQSYLRNVPEERKKQPRYKKVWSILTIAWAALNVSQAILRIVLLYSVSVSSYYAISTAYDNITSPALLAFSIMFSIWYLKRQK